MRMADDDDDDDYSNGDNKGDNKDSYKENNKDKNKDNHKNEHANIFCIIANIHTPREVAEYFFLHLNEVSTKTTMRGKKTRSILLAGGEQKLRA